MNFFTIDSIFFFISCQCSYINIHAQETKRFAMSVTICIFTSNCIVVKLKNMYESAVLH